MKTIQAFILIFSAAVAVAIAALMPGMTIAQCLILLTCTTAAAFAVNALID